MVIFYTIVMIIVWIAFMAMAHEASENRKALIHQAQGQLKNGPTDLIAVNTLLQTICKKTVQQTLWTIAKVIVSTAAVITIYFPETVCSFLINTL